MLQTSNLFFLGKFLLFAELKSSSLMLIGAYIMLANAILCFRVNENLNPYSLGELKSCTIRQTLVSLVRDLAKLKKLCSFTSLHCRD